MLTPFPTVGLQDKGRLQTGQALTGSPHSLGLRGLPTRSESAFNPKRSMDCLLPLNDLQSQTME